MKVLLIGGGGQLGKELQLVKPSDITLLAPTSSELDITQHRDVTRFVVEHEPDFIINAAAYTAVDQAEQDSSSAYAVNTEAVHNLASLAGEGKARLIHISTDFVFDGLQSRPYRPNDPAKPLSVYGASKYQGELAVMESGANAVILRTAWLYSRHGHNFVKTMLRLMKQKESLSVVYDQIGTPTWAHNLAHLIWKVARKPEAKGIYHFTDAGVASWYDFAKAIQDEALDLKLLDHGIPITPIRSQDYPTPARRPTYSVLDKQATWWEFEVQPQHWRDALRKMLCDLASK